MLECTVGITINESTNTSREVRPQAPRCSTRCSPSSRSSRWPRPCRRRTRPAQTGHSRARAWCRARRTSRPVREMSLFPFLLSFSSWLTSLASRHMVRHRADEFVDDHHAVQQHRLHRPGIHEGMGHRRFRCAPPPARVLATMWWSAHQRLSLMAGRLVKRQGDGDGGRLGQAQADGRRGDALQAGHIFVPCAFTRRLYDCPCLISPTRF